VGVRVDGKEGLRDEEVTRPGVLFERGHGPVVH